MNGKNYFAGFCYWFMSTALVALFIAGIVAVWRDISEMQGWEAIMGFVTIVLFSIIVCALAAYGATSYAPDKKEKDKKEIK